MRWLWKDYPQPVTVGQTKNVFLKAILLSGEDWQSVPGDYQSDGKVLIGGSGQTSSVLSRLNPFSASRTEIGVFGKIGRKIMKLPTFTNTKRIYI